MIYKKIVLCSLFFSGQALGMLVNPIKKRHIQMPKQRPNLKKFSYEQFFKSQRSFIQELPIDILSHIRDPHLDFNSNARLSMTCKNLYREYRNKGFALSPEAYMREMINASRVDNKKRVKSLIKREANPHTKQRETILQCFKIDCADIPAVMGIYKKKYDYECRDFMKLKTEIPFEDLVKNPIVCQLLFEQGLSPNIKGEHGETVLMEAARYNCIETLKLLLANPRVNPNMQTTDGHTALSIAIHANQIEALKLLLVDPRIAPNIQDKYGETALIAAAKHNSIEALKLLLANPIIDPNIQSKHGGETALMIAAKHNSIEALKLLLADPRIAPNIQDNYGYTVSNIAFWHDTSEAFKSLLANERIDQKIFYTTLFYMKNFFKAVGKRLADPKFQASLLKSMSKHLKKLNKPNKKNGSIYSSFGKFNTSFGK